jgi:hypothetical protein
MTFTSGNYIKKFYVMSLSTEGSAILDDVPIADIVNKGDSLLLTLTCKDARDETYSTKFDIDFQTISLENRKLAYQYDDFKKTDRE